MSNSEQIHLSDVVSIAGMPGLYLVVKSDDRSIIVEALDETRKRSMIRSNMMVSKLVDISIFTKDEAESQPLGEVLRKLNDQYGETLPVTKRSNKEDLMDFLYSVLPEYDPDRVYPNNVKKLISWHNILVRENVDLSAAEENSEAEGSEAEGEEASRPENKNALGSSNTDATNQE